MCGSIRRRTPAFGVAGKTEFAEYIKRECLKTLLFAGVNTDQCVLATMLDAAQQGYDTILLKDACGTVSLPFARDMVEFNASKAFGFVASCASFVEGVEMGFEGAGAS
jgi:nicotinamidase-related amidase